MVMVIEAIMANDNWIFCGMPATKKAENSLKNPAKPATFTTVDINDVIHVGAP